MDALEEIRQLLEAKQGSEDSVVRRSEHIKWLWTCIIFMMTTGFGWIIFVTLWYSKVERTCHAVELIYESYFGTKLP